LKQCGHRSFFLGEAGPEFEATESGGTRCELVKGELRRKSKWFHSKTWAGMKGTRIYPDHFSRINPVLTGQSIGIKSREVRIAVDLLEL